MLMEVSYAQNMLLHPGLGLAFRKDTERNGTMSLPQDSIVYSSILGRWEWLFDQSILTFLNYQSKLSSMF